MDIEKLAKNILESEFGYQVKKISEGDKKSPDFFVNGNGERFLIELKSKFDDEGTVRNIERTLAQGEVAEFSDITGRKNAISKIICEASEQLASIDIEVDYRMIWLMAVNRNQKMKKDQFKASLYGTATICDLDLLQTVSCYYFGFNDFYRTKGVIDAALISTMEGGEFCLNTHSSPNYPKIKESFLAQKFGSACRDPFKEEKEKNTVIVDADIDRRDKQLVLKYLRAKYNRKKLQDMHGHYYSSIITVSKNELV